MLPEGVLSIGIGAGFWQPHKNERKAELIKILASACCPRQIEHIDIKRVAYNHVTAILQRCQKGQKCVVFLLLFLLFCHTCYFHAISQELLQIETYLIHR